MDVERSPTALGLDKAPALTRRARLRGETIAEIKRLAWAQVAEGGALAVSLRSIAHQMGLTSSALYRYFTSHEQLLTELAVDGFASLADSLETVESELAPTSSAADRFLQLAAAYRRWSLEHATEYALIFGTPLARLCANERVLPEHERGVAVLFRVMIAGLENGELDTAQMPQASARLTGQIRRWQESIGLPLPPQALSGCMFVWAQLHGAISLELFGQLPGELAPAGDLFDLQMRAVLVSLGCPRTATGQPSELLS